MNFRYHRIPHEVFAALAAGGGGAEALRHLTSVQYSRHVLLMRGITDAVADTAHPQAEQVRLAYTLLAEVQEHAPDVVEAILRYPATGAWARRTLQELVHGERESAEPARLATLAAAAAVRARLPREIQVPMIDGAVTLPSVGQAFLPHTAGDAVVRCTTDGAEIVAGDRRVLLPADPQQDGPGWRGLRQLTASAGGRRLRLVIDDLDPYRMPAATDLGDRLTAAEAEVWRSALGTAWSLLVRRHWTTADEVMTAIRVLTPLASSPSGQVSASSGETFGCAAMSTPPDGRTLAVTLAHEVQHAKLTALLDVVTLTHPDNGARHYAPWRDDPRPINGLLQGAYAYLGVTGFWRRQRDHESGADALHAHAEFARWRAATDLVVDTLRGSGRLTAAGERFVAGMARTLRPWLAEQVPPPALSLARERAERHRVRWERHNGTLAGTCQTGR